ncbi:hypothetical protein KSP39_PZI022640 [Platanthera zijinensis]|uniref:Uncharacterized protein n=1 Tax=Platanthera zijinensis TaxID=2320716 RepID=A0AAP0AUU5_9ASPA
METRSNGLPEEGASSFMKRPLRFPASFCRQKRVLINICCGSREAPSSQHYCAMSTIAVRFLIDRAQKRVVLAEAGSDFVDVLFSFLTLPLASIVRLLEKQTGLGSLDTLYESAEQLDAEHFRTEACKEMLLNPRSAAALLCEGFKLKGIHDSDPRNFFTCGENDCLTQSTSYYTYNSKCLCSRCGKLMGKTWQWPQRTSAEGGIFFNDMHNFMITDDLQVIPSSLPKGLSLFKEMQIKNASKLEERVIDFGKEEILNLLKRSFVSTNLLTDVCFPDACVQASAGFFLPKKDESFDNKAEQEISLIKLILNKKNNIILYAEVGVDFINLLFSLLNFPLGAVLPAPDNLSLGGCIKNLYSSAESMGLEYFKSEICRKMLLNPKLPAFSRCNMNQILQLEKITSESLITGKGCLKCYLDNGYKAIGSAPCEHGIQYAQVIEWNPKSAKTMSRADEAFVVGSQKYMILDKLDVSSLSICCWLTKVYDFR